MRARRGATEDYRRRLPVLALVFLTLGFVLGCSERPQRVDVPIEAYLQGLTRSEILAVRMCWRRCDEARPIAEDQWGGLLEALERSRPRPYPLGAFKDWEWVCRVNIDKATPNWLDVSVQEATFGLERGTYAVVQGGGVGEDYGLFDGALVADWCLDLENRAAEE